MPIATLAHMLITRPRISPPIRVWIADWQIVLEALAAADMAATRPIATGQDAVSPRPATHATPHMLMAAANGRRLRPKAGGSNTSPMPETIAPNPVDAVNRPRPVAPLAKTPTAMTGKISSVPNMNIDATAERARAARMPESPKANRTP